MPTQTRSLSSRPSLEFLRKQAKEFLKDLQRERPDAKLAEAQHSLAREYGVARWADLKEQLQKPGSQILRDVTAALRIGKPVILYDDCGREDEGDFVFAAEHITADAINFLTKKARGTICLALAPQRVDQLGLPLVRAEREAPAHPAFTWSIDAATGITTGVSAADRAATILAAVADDATAAAVRSPGHIFPLRGVDGGFRARKGHTEGSLALMQEAGLKPAAVICEILNDDGTMARLRDVQALSIELKIPLVCFSDLQY